MDFFEKKLLETDWKAKLIVFTRLYFFMLKIVTGIGHLNLKVL
jgi:hypothetical protein